MPVAALNNALTSDVYTDALTLVGVPLDSFLVQVYNAAVYYQLGAGGNFNTPERFLGPGYHVRERPGYDSIKFRSAAAGKPASVTVEPKPAP